MYASLPAYREGIALASFANSDVFQPRASEELMKIKAHETARCKSTRWHMQECDVTKRRPGTIAYMPQYGWRYNAQLSSEAQWRAMQHYPALLLLGAVIPFARRKVVEIPHAAIDRMLNVLHILKQLCCTFRVQSFVSDEAIQAFDLQHNDV
eukprot:21036-Heterococcus_DN1.PRE.2